MPSLVTHCKGFVTKQIYYGERHMEQPIAHQGGESCEPYERRRWPRYLGAAALDAWLTRVAACETPTQPPSVELFIAQYSGDEIDEPASARNGAFQLPFHLLWGDEKVPADLSERPLTPDDAEVTRRILTTTVDVLAGRTALFSLYEHLQPKAYAAMETRLRTGTRLPRYAELRSTHGQYPAKGVIEACGIASYGCNIQALCARLERRRRRWVSAVLRVV